MERTYFSGISLAAVRGSLALAAEQGNRAGQAQHVDADKAVRFVAADGLALVGARGDGGAAAAALLGRGGRRSGAEGKSEDSEDGGELHVDGVELKERSDYY